MNYWILGTLVLSLISPIFYTRSMLAGKAKPHRVTRLIVWLAAAAGLLGVIHSTNRSGIIFAAIFLGRASYLLIMSWIYGVGGSTRLDKTCLTIGALAVILYFLTGSGLLAVTFGIAADLIGYIPTFVKTWHKPQSEDPLFFSLETLAALFGVFAIWEIRVDILFPIYFTLGATTIVVLIYRRRLTSLFLKSRPADF